MPTTKPTTRILNVPVEVYDKYEAAARQVAQSSPLLAAVPLAKLTPMLMQVDLERAKGRDIAKRFVRNFVQQVKFDVPPATTPPVPAPPPVSRPAAS